MANVPLDEGVRTSLAWVDSTHVLVPGAGFQLLLIGPGGVERRVGRRGDGPGEFHYPFDVAVAEDGTVLVLDGFVWRVQRFTPGLRYIDRVPSPKFANDLAGLVGDTIGVLWQVFPADSLGRGAGLQLLGEDSARARWRLGSIDPVFSGLYEPEGDQEGPSPFLVLRRDGRFVLAEGRDYRLWLLDQSGRVMTTGGRAGLPAERDSVSASELDTEIAAARRRAPEPALADQAERAVRRRYSAPRWKIRQMAAAPDGTLWVIADRGRRDSTRIDLLDTSLTYFGTVTVEGPVWAIDIRSDRVAMLLGDPGEDEWTVRLWRYARPN